MNSTPLPQGFERLKFGGVLLIKAGTYIIKNTVLIPPGITLLGEGYGTKIINATSLDTSTVPPQPKLSPTPAPVFKIVADTNRSSNDGAVDPNMFVFARETRIINMVISDNFVEPTSLGDTFYKIPQNKTSATALNPPSLISQQLGSNLSMDGVVATGRVNFSSGTIVSQATGTLWSIDNSTADTETFCKLNNCFVDGFSIPFDGYSAINAQDYLEIKNSKIRAYGYFNGDSTDGYDNTIIRCLAQNLSLTGSYLDGNASNITSLVYMYYSNTAINTQSRSKVVISNNQVVINKASGAFNSSWQPILFAPTFVQNMLLPIYPSAVVSLLLYGNSFQDTFDLYIDGGVNPSASSGVLGLPSISMTPSAVTINNSGTTTVNSASHFVGNMTVDGNVLVDGYQFQIANPGASFVIDNNTTTTASINNGSAITMQSGSVVNANSGSYMAFLTGSTINASYGSTLTFDGYITYNTHRVSSNYTCDTYIPNWSDYIVFVDSSTNAVTITLPPPSYGRVIIIKDLGNATSHNVKITSSHAYEFTILTISTNFGSLTFCSDGSNWFVIAEAPSIVY